MQKEINFNIASETKPDILDGLNNEQKKAVIHNEGPLLIIAGAGTGKTVVITRRIANLIEKKLAEPSEILALTFTEKAAAEMEDRVDKLVPYGFTDMWISTFHAFGDRLLRDYSLELGLPANFKVLTATQQAIFIRENLYAFDLNYYRPIANPISHIEAMLSHFSRLKDELITPEIYVDHAQNKLAAASSDDEKEAGERLLEIANAYQRYCDLMIQAGNLDFGDQIFLTYKLLKENKKVLGACQDKFKFILVDEYQDTNFAQNEIVKLLAQKDKNITVVGDDDQSIYRFRGASISNILQFKDSYDKITQIVLNKNYRSTQEILDASYKLIQHNNPDRLEFQNKIDKRLSSQKKGALPELLHCDSLSCEADTVVSKIISLKKDNNFRNNDFAILVRANSHAEPFIESLNLAGIPYAFSGASDLFMQPEIKMLASFLKCLVYSDDNLSFYYLATSELYGVSPDILTEFHTIARRKNRSVISIVDNSINQESSLFENDKMLEAVITDIKSFRQKLSGLNAGELLYEYLAQKGYLKKLSKDPSVEDELKIQNIAKFFDRIAQFNYSSEDKGVLAFLKNLELLLEVGEEVITSDIDPDTDAINILTAHASKGLEWPVVFVANCVSDRFPSRRKRDQIELPRELIKERLPEGDFHLQEERRLFYVAATRAKDYLFLSAADDYGGKRTKKLSQFVLELLDEPNPDRLKNKLSPVEKIERFKKVEKEIGTKSLSKNNKFLDSDRMKLSRQQIDDYFTCPKKFYYAHIIKIPLLENQQLMYGTAIHAALDHYFGRKIRGEEVGLPQLLSDFDQAFRNVGFITRKHEEQRHKSGTLALTKFFDADQKEKSIPAEVESVFQFAEEKVSVNGRYDLIYKTGDSVEIRDFKTSNVKDQKEADRRISESTQMKIYALAWFEKYKEIPQTTLFFIESGLKGEKTFAQKELEETKSMILEVSAGIKSGDMTAKPDMFSCKYCAYKDICPEAKG